MNKKRLWGLFLAIIVVSGCSKDEKIVDIVEADEQEAGDAQEEQVETFKYSQPFTGEGIESENTARPILVTINNHPKARPQAGISSADVVYEMLVEADATRYLALFQSKLPENIGPIRSARDYLIEIAGGFDGFYVAHGYSPEAHQMLNKKVVENINGMQYDGIYFERSKDRKAPHNSYISGENLKLGAEKVNATLEMKKKVGMAFYDTIDNVKIGIKANEIHMNYNNSTSPYNSIYQYDAETGLYAKSSPSKPTLDALTNEQVTIANVLFLEMPHRVIDAESRRELTLTEGGQAFIFQQGMMREVAWKNVNGLLVAIEDDGSEVQLIPGKSWIHLVPTTPGLTASVVYSE